MGSGFGGLALAIRLQAAGVQTVLFEARDRPGGRAYVYQQDGFTFDAGPTVITAPGCLEELFALAGESMADQVELLPVLPFYRLAFADGILARLRRRPRRACAPASAAWRPATPTGYERFLAYSQEVFQAGYEGLAALALPALRRHGQGVARAGPPGRPPQRLRHASPAS